MRIFSSSYLPNLVLMGSLAAALVSCEEPELPEATPVTASTVGLATVRVVNAAPGTTGPTFTIDALTVPAGNTPLPYLSTTVVSNVLAGQRLFLFTEPTNIPATPAAATAAGIAPLTAARLFPVRSSFSGNTSYTIFLTDQPTRAYAYPVTGTSDQGGIRNVTLTDNLAAPAANRARVRFINLSPSYTGGADSLGLFTIASPAPTTNPTRINQYLFAPIGRAYRNIAYTIPAVAATSTTPARAARSLNFATFTDIAAGAYTFEVRRSANITTNASQVIVPATPLTFASGKIYTIYTRGTNGSTTAPLGLSTVLHN